MNYTQTYHLPQWDETDRVLMQDFNEAMAGIEAGLTEAQTTASDTQAPVAAAQAAADAAQAAADAAQRTADTALTKANQAWSPNHRFYATRSYIGTGTNSPNTITVGFRPSLVLMSADSGINFAVVYPGTKAGSVSTLTWYDDGFKVGGRDVTGNCNENNVRYSFFAVR